MRNITVTKFANPQRVRMPGTNRYHTPNYLVVDDANGLEIENIVSFSIDREIHQLIPVKMGLCFEDGSEEAVIAKYIKEPEISTGHQIN